MATLTACPACGGQLRTWLSVPAAEPSLRGISYELVRCARCGSAWTVGDAEPEWHDTGAYSPGTPRLHGLARPLLELFDRQRLTLLKRVAPPPARVLDAGAGRGRWVLAALRAGYQASGIEPSARGAAATAEIGAPVVRASIEEAVVAAESLDAVSLWHVLEHLDDPPAALEAIHGWLRPGGILLVGVPNLNSWQARLGGERWYHLDLPRHSAHLTVEGLHRLLERSGFEVLHTQHLLLEQNPYGMWQSLVNRLTRRPSYLYNLLKRNAPLLSPDFPLSIVALPLLIPAAVLELVAGLARRGGTVAVLARRRSDPAAPAPPGSRI